MVRTGSLHLPETSTEDTLHTPHILPHEENPTSESQCFLNISRVPSLDEDLLKLGASRESVGGEILDKLYGNGKDGDESLDSTFNMSRVPSIDEDLLIIANDDSESERDVITNEKTTVKENKETPQPNSTNKELKMKLLETVQNRTKRKRPLKLLDESHGIIIAPVDIDKIKNAESATLLINPKTDPSCTKTPRKRITKQSNAIKKTKDVPQEVSPEKEKVRERNRAAQSRSRNRKKKWINEMSKKIDDLAKENKNLTAINQQLTSEINLVRSILQYHTDCSATKDPEISIFTVSFLFCVILFICVFQNKK